MIDDDFNPAKKKLSKSIRKPAMRSVCEASLGALCLRPPKRYILRNLRALSTSAPTIEPFYIVLSYSLL